MKMNVALLMTLIFLAVACSSKEFAQSEQPTPAETTMAENTAEETTMQGMTVEEEADASIGEEIEFRDFSLRVFYARYENTAYFYSSPNASAASEDNPDGGYVIVDYVGDNLADGPALIQPEATLEDSEGNSYEASETIDSPTDDPDGREMPPGESVASALYFEVPEGTEPEALRLSSEGERARVDLTREERGGIPVSDYLHVYHLWFNQRAYEEIYSLFDPTTTQGVTEEQWVSYFDGLWGEWFLGLEGGDIVAETEGQSTYGLNRTFHGADGSVTSDTVYQDVVKIGEEWNLVMRQDQLDDILGVQDFEAPAPEESVPELTIPEYEAPDAEYEDLYDCDDFLYQEDAQAAYDTDPSDPYGLDEEGDGVACEALPSLYDIDDYDGIDDYETDEPDFAEEETIYETDEPEVYGPGPLAPVPSGADGSYNCSDFSSQEQAQTYLLPGDPHGLDRDGDDIACEELP